MILMRTLSSLLYYDMLCGFPWAYQSIRLSFSRPIFVPLLHEYNPYATKLHLFDECNIQEAFCNFIQIVKYKEIQHKLNIQCIRSQFIQYKHNLLLLNILQKRKTELHTAKMKTDQFNIYVVHVSASLCTDITYSTEHVRMSVAKKILQQQPQQVLGDLLI